MSEFEVVWNKQQEDFEELCASCLRAVYTDFLSNYNNEDPIEDIVKEIIHEEREIEER